MQACEERSHGSTHTGRTRAPAWLRGRRRIVASVGLALAALALLVWLLRAFDGGALARTLASLGSRTLLVPIPFALALVLDTQAWRLLLRGLGRRVPFGPLAKVRLSLEAVTLSLPGGSLVADAATPARLQRQCGIPFAEGVALTAMRKGLLVVAHAFFLALAAALAFGAAGASRTLPPGLALAGALALIVATALAAGLLLRGRAAVTVLALLARVPGARLRRWRERHTALAEEIDARLHQAARASRVALAGAFALLAACFVLDAVEAFVILRLLGARLPFTQVLPAEGLAQLARLAAVGLPAGLGVQDAGYVALLAASGQVPAVTLGAAFVLVKRGREALTALAGWALWLRPGAPARPRLPAGAPALRACAWRTA